MKSLFDLYKDPKLGYTSLSRFYNNIKGKYPYSYKEVKDFLDKNPTEQIHKEEKRIFLPIKTAEKRQQYQIDLITLVKSKSKLLDVIDNVRKSDLRYILCLIES